MQHRKHIKGLLFLLGWIFCSCSALATENAQGSGVNSGLDLGVDLKLDLDLEVEGLETFFAISLVGGIYESNNVNRNYQREDQYFSEITGNLEVQLRWNGFFYENPGDSQENVDGLFAGDAIGYNFYNTRDWAFDIYAYHAFGENNFVFAGDVERADPETGEIIPRFERLEIIRKKNHRLGLRATGYFRDFFTQFIVAPYSFQDDIGGFNASASVRRTLLYKNWNFYGTLGVSYYSADIMDFYFGLSEEEAKRIAEFLQDDNSPFQPFKGKGGFYAVGQIGFEYPVMEHFVVGGYATIVRQPDSLVDSAANFQGRYSTSTALTLTWIF